MGAQGHCQPVLAELSAARLPEPACTLVLEDHIQMSWRGRRSRVPMRKQTPPRSAHGKRKPVTHRNWQDDLGIASQVGDVAVEGHPLLHGTSLADSQGHAQDGVCTKLGWNRTELNEGMSYPPAFLQLAFPPGPPLCAPWIVF